MAEVSHHLAWRGLVLQPTGFNGKSAALPDGRVLYNDYIWHEVPADEAAILATTGALVQAIHHKYGPGKIWPFGPMPLVHVVADDGVQVRDGKCRVRAMYFHERSSEFLMRKPSRPITPP